MKKIALLYGEAELRDRRLEKEFLEITALKVRDLQPERETDEAPPLRAATGPLYWHYTVAHGEHIYLLTLAAVCDDRGYPVQKGFVLFAERLESLLAEARRQLNLKSAALSSAPIATAYASVPLEAYAEAAGYESPRFFVSLEPHNSVAALARRLLHALLILEALLAFALLRYGLPYIYREPTGDRPSPLPAKSETTKSGPIKTASKTNAKSSAKISEKAAGKPAAKTPPPITEHPVSDSGTALTAAPSTDTQAPVQADEAPPAAGPTAVAPDQADSPAESANPGNRLISDRRRRTTAPTLTGLNRKQTRHLTSAPLEHRFLYRGLRLRFLCLAPVLRPPLRSSPPGEALAGFFAGLLSDHLRASPQDSSANSRWNLARPARPPGAEPCPSSSRPVSCSFF